MARPGARQAGVSTGEPKRRVDPRPRSVELEPHVRLHDRAVVVEHDPLERVGDRLRELVDIGALAIDDGTISGPGNVRTSYWELAGEISLEREATPGAVPKRSTSSPSGTSPLDE